MLLLPSSLLLFLSLAIPSTAEGNACQAPGPIALPIGNVSVTDTGVKRWGLKAQFGTPPQILAPSVNPDWNNTSLWSYLLMCGKMSRPECAWTRGGSLEAKKSETFRKEHHEDVYEFRKKDGTDLGISPWGFDTFTVNSSTVLKEFPIWSKSAGVLPQNAIGLGRNSSFLNILAQQKYIASKTWSLFWGWQGRYKKQQMEGNFVIGGYDKAKVRGKSNATMGFTDDPACPTGLLVLLSDITVNHITGDKTNLLGGKGSAMQMCVKPDQPMISLTQDAFEKFNKSLPGTQYGKSTGIYAGGISIDPKKSFVGNITFTTVSGVDITVPNHQLVLPNIAIDSETAEHYYEDGNKTIMISHEPVKDIPILGQAFLSSAYLHVDNHQKEFTLWEANPTDKMQLVTVEHNEDGEKHECEGEETQSPSLVPGEGDDGSGESGDGNGGGAGGLSGGAIAGIVIGAIAGVALVAAAIWFFLLRRRREQNAQAWALRRLTGGGSGKARPPEDALENIPPNSDMKVLMSPPEELDGGEGHKALSEMGVREGAAMELPGDTTFPEQIGSSETTGEQMPRGSFSGDYRSSDMISPEPMSATTVSSGFRPSGDATGSWGSHPNAFTPTGGLDSALSSPTSPRRY